MPSYPKQEIARRATVARRDRVTIYRDAAAGGSSQPSYTQLVAENVPAEVLQVSGGEMVRGRQVEAHTTFVLSLPHLPQLSLSAECRVNVGTGQYRGVVIHVHRVHLETDRSRPVAVQLHGKMIDFETPLDVTYMLTGYVKTGYVV